MGSAATSDNMFTHEHLPDSAKYMRLLEVLDDDYSKTIKVRCSITTWPVDSMPPYHAISYTWGDPKSNTLILMNDRTLQVRNNCELALKQAYWYWRSQSYLYRKRRSRLYREDRPEWYTKSQYFWVDAICIDQTNLEEKGKQVAMMGNIYKKASHVLSCIGDHADDSLFFFRTLYGLTHLVVPARQIFRPDPFRRGRPEKGNEGVSLKFRMLHRYSTTHRFLLALARLALRPYFTRMWILQELQHAQKITILCGQYVLSKEDAIYLFDELAQGLKRFDKELNQYELAIAPHQGYMNMKFYRRLVNHGMPHPVWHGDWLCRLPSQCTATVIMLKQANKAVKRNIFKLLNDVVYRLECMDPRDKVYGLISLIDWGELAPLEPDYRQTDLEVAINFIEAIIKFGDVQDLDEPLWKYVVVIIMLFHFNIESKGFPEALKARRGYIEKYSGAAGTTPSGSSTLRLEKAAGWRLTPLDIDRNAARLQGLQASPRWYPPCESFYLPEWAAADDWVIQVDFRNISGIWYGLFHPLHLKVPTYTPLLIMREGSKGCRNELIGYGFYSERGEFHRPAFKYDTRVDVTVNLGVEDAIIFFWRMKQLCELKLGATNWMVDYLNTGVCRQQTPASSYVMLPPELPARVERIEPTAKDIELDALMDLKADLFVVNGVQSGRCFVLFDTAERRGWLVNGQVVVVQLLCAFLKNTPLAEPFDFSRWENFDPKNPMSSFQVLSKVDNLTIPILRVLNDVGETSAHDELPNSPPNVDRKLILEVLNDIIAVTNKVSSKLAFPGDSARYTRARFDPSPKRLKRRRNVTVRGWDFDQIHRSMKARTYTYKFDRDPGWLELAEDLNVDFLFGSDFGDIMKRRDDCCCPYFKTVPKGHDFLAVDAAILRSHVDPGEEKDERVARFNSNFAWERGADPLSHPHGQGDHLDRVDANCLPLQRRIKMPDKFDAGDTDRLLLKEKRDRIYSGQEIEDMLVASHTNTTSNNRQMWAGGEQMKLEMIVFGNTPDDRELRQLAEANLRDAHSFDGPQLETGSAAPTAGPSPEASSNHAAPKSSDTPEGDTPSVNTRT